MGQKLNPRQKKVIGLIPEIETGQITKKDALLKAGYKESTANQQQAVFGAIRNNEKMQAALEKAGVTDERIAKKIHVGMTDRGAVGLGYTKLAVELKDVMPVKRIQTEDVTPQTYGGIKDKAAKSAAEARQLAEEAVEEEEED